MAMHLRPGETDDWTFLEAMLFEAFFWDPSSRRPALSEFREEREAAKLLAGWGRRGDRAIIAEEADARAGAAWFRLWTDADHSYGFVRADIPELGLAVHPAFRRQGIGTALLRALAGTARAEGFPGISLSVSPANPARRLYERAGFRKVGESGTSSTYLLSLAP